MPDDARAIGLAALSLCESILLSLTENGLIDDAEARGILEDAANAHRGAAPYGDVTAEDHKDTAELLEAMLKTGNSVRRADH